MDRDEAADAVKETAWTLPQAQRERLMEALKTLLLNPAELSAGEIRAMIPAQIEQLSEERRKVAERIDSASARGALPSPHDYGTLSLYHQQLARWRALRDDVERGTDSQTALRRARRLALEAMVRSNPHIGTPFAQAAAKVGQQAAAAFLRSTDPEEER